MVQRGIPPPNGGSGDAQHGVAPRATAGDATSLASWQRICAASRREFEALYTRLGVTLQERGESFYNPMLKVGAAQERFRRDK